MKLYLKDNESIPAVQILEDADPTPSGYTDFSQDLLAWRDYGLLACSDYNHFRTRVIEQLDLKTWGNTSILERNFIINIDVKESSLSHTADQSNKNSHLILTGQAIDSDAAAIVLSVTWSNSFVMDVEACHKRYKSIELYKIISTYLSPSDRHEFFAACSSLFMNFAHGGVRGSAECSVDGIFDWVESTSTYSITGLASNSWTMYNGDADETGFVIALMSIIRDGNY